MAGERCVVCKKTNITYNTAYLSKSDIHFLVPDKNGEIKTRMVVCRNCVNERYNDYYGKLNSNTALSVFQTCRYYNIPYLPHILDMALKQLDGEEYSRDKVFSRYMQKIFSLKWKPGDPACFEDGVTELKAVAQVDGETDEDSEEVWGLGYTLEEYRAFNKKYNRLKNNYPEKTSMHTEALFKYIRYSCKEELATAKGDVKSAKDWAAMAQAAATAAKINPSQLSQADLQGGLNSISEISKAAEEQFDIIQILPEFKYRPNDAPDFIIWNYLNYGRKAKGLPIIEYSDVYKFYDEKKQEYIEQTGDPYGIFKDDPTEINRIKVEKFINVPKASDD
jgi:hypothetical protein